MTIGEKITSLRQKMKLSQEDLGEKMGVSRQSISKWEMDQALPQIDKVIALCELFSISTDTLLLDKIEITDDKPKNKYFGTDGFRGEANIDLTADQAYKVGRFLGWYFNTKSGSRRARIVIGKDTRLSSYMLEYSIVAGITASGADAYMLHVTTTPSVSYVTRMDNFDCGIMITASHNPYYDNGIKVINRYGEKLDDATTELIEQYIDGDIKNLDIVGADIPFAQKNNIGRITDYVAGRNRYVGYLISLASHSYKHLRIGIDSANGASWMIARSVFGALGAQMYVIGDEPDGLNVNHECGSTKIEKLQKLVRDEHLDCGFAFDGDCDRCIAVDEQGNVVDGDSMLYILAKRLKVRGMLNSNTLVATIMSNSGLKKSLAPYGIDYVETTVGDRYVYECMQENDYSLGGEQSGHIIIKKYATTGDGILTAIMIAEEMCDTKLSLGELRKDLTLYPQYMENVRVRDKAEVMSDSEVLASLESVKCDIGDSGRALLRQSGTEPVIRVMIECEDEDKCREYARRISDTIRERGYACEEIRYAK